MMAAQVIGGKSE